MNSSILLTFRLELVNNSKKLSDDILASLSNINKPDNQKQLNSDTIPNISIPANVFSLLNSNASNSNSNNQVIVHEKLEIRTEHGGQVDIVQKNSVVEIPVESDELNIQDPRKTIVGKWSKKHKSFQLLTYDGCNKSQTIEGVDFDQLKNILTGNIFGDHQQGDNSFSIDFTNSNEENVDFNICFNQPFPDVLKFNFQNSSNPAPNSTTTSDLSKLLPALFQNIESKNEMEVDPEPLKENASSKEPQENVQREKPQEKKMVKEKHVTFKRNSQLEKIIESRNESIIKEANIDKKIDKIFAKRTGGDPEQASEIEKDKKNVIDNFKFLLNYDLCKSEKSTDGTIKVKEKGEKTVEAKKSDDVEPKDNENCLEVLNKSFDIYDDLDYECDVYDDLNEEPEIENKEKTGDDKIESEKIVEEVPKENKEDKICSEKIEWKSDSDKMETKSKSDDDKTKLDKTTEKDRYSSCAKQRQRDIKRDDRENRDLRHSKSQTPSSRRSPHRRYDDRSRHHLSASSTSIRNRENQSKYSSHSSRNDSRTNSSKTSPRSCKYDRRDDDKKRKLSPVHSRLSFDDNRSSKHKKV